MSEHETSVARSGLDIAIIGVAGRFPGAQDVDAFWQNLRDRVESIAALTDQELMALGVDPAALHRPKLCQGRRAPARCRLF